MIRVGFVAGHSREWIGGINYHRNLLYAITCLDDKQIEPVVFLGHSADPYLVATFSPLAQVVRTRLLDRNSWCWWLGKIFTKLLHSAVLWNKLFERYNINVVSHSDIAFPGIRCRTINWIPDFQHLRLPEMFSSADIAARNRLFDRLLGYSDAVIVSCEAALDDCKWFCRNKPKLADKVHVLRFVAQAGVVSENADCHVTLTRYSAPARYFFLPNQFWKHKNHLQVFRAVKELKHRGLEIRVLCSGAMSDFRNPSYIDSVKKFIDENDLHGNISLLGLVDYRDLICLMRYSIAVINPSLFEGWSTTVEECKSLGKNMVLSNIKVHIEQAPLGSVYFDIDDPSTLENILATLWENPIDLPQLALEENAAAALPHRTIHFAKQYQNIVLQTFLNERDESNSNSSSDYIHT